MCAYAITWSLSLVFRVTAPPSPTRRVIPAVGGVEGWAQGRGHPSVNGRVRRPSAYNVDGSHRAGGFPAALDGRRRLKCPSGAETDGGKNGTRRRLSLRHRGPVSHSQ